MASEDIKTKKTTTKMAAEGATRNPAATKANVKDKPAEAQQNADLPLVAAPAVVTEGEKTKKPRKQKLVRDSFKFPEQEYAAIDALKARCLENGQAIKKSELVRAGLVALQALSDKQLLRTLDSLEKLKAGRPAK